MRLLLTLAVLAACFEAARGCASDNDCSHCAGHCKGSSCVGTDCVPRFDVLEQAFKLTLVNATDVEADCLRNPHDKWCRIVQSCCK